VCVATSRGELVCRASIRSVGFGCLARQASSQMRGGGYLGEERRGIDRTSQRWWNACGGYIYVQSDGVQVLPNMLCCVVVLQRAWWSKNSGRAVSGRKGALKLQNEQ
jgi:hypothetical protein